MATDCCPENPEGHQALANLRMIQSRYIEAAKHLEQAISLTEKIRAADLDEFMPTYEFRTDTVKLCIELLRYRSAANTIRSLLEEDDRFIEIHYLRAMSLWRSVKYKYQALRMNGNNLQQQYSFTTVDTDEKETSIFQAISAELDSETTIDEDLLIAVDSLIRAKKMLKAVPDDNIGQAADELF